MWPNFESGHTAYSTFDISHSKSTVHALHINLRLSLHLTLMVLRAVLQTRVLTPCSPSDTIFLAIALTPKAALLTSLCTLVPA